MKECKCKNPIVSTADIMHCCHCDGLVSEVASEAQPRSGVRISDVVGRERERTTTTEADSCAVGREESESVRELNLAACPFCGEETKIGLLNPNARLKSLFGILCVSCGGSIFQAYRTAKEAAAAWNKRAGDKNANAAPTLASATASERLTPNAELTDAAPVTPESRETQSRHSVQ
jgi:hypothetical protein